MKKARKILSMLLALALLLTSVQVPAYAAQPDGEAVEASAAPEAEKDVSDGKAAENDAAADAGASADTETPAFAGESEEAVPAVENNAGEAAFAGESEEKNAGEAAFAGESEEAVPAVENNAGEAAFAGESEEKNPGEAAFAGEDEEAGEEEPTAGVTLVGDEQKLAGTTLASDLALKGDFVFESGTLDLNGFTLTIDGNLLHSNGDIVVNGGSLIVTGDYRIQNRKDDGTYEECGGALVMRNENDRVQVDGDFYVSGDTSYWDGKDTVRQMLTAGTLIIGRGLHQQFRSDGFRAQDSHKTILAGAGEGKKCSVSFTHPDSCLGILEMAEGADIDWTGYFNVETLGNDVTVAAPSGSGEGIAVYGSNDRMNFNGHALTVSGNVRDLVGLLYVGGARRAGESFEPDKAGSFIVDGDFLHQSGDLVADGGYVKVTGDWRIQRRNDDGTYEECGAALVMTNASDDVQVDGELYVSGDTSYWDGVNTIRQMLTAGTLTVGKGLHQLYRTDGFCASGGHRTILAGAGANKKCSVSFGSEDSCLGILEMAEGADIDWTGAFNVETLGNDVTIAAPAGTGKGIAVYSKNGRMNFNGHMLTVNGSIRNLSGLLCVGGANRAEGAFDPEKAGSLVVNGSFLQQDGDLVADGGHVKVTGDWRIQRRYDDGTYGECGAALVMRNAYDDVQVDGELYVSGDTGYWDGSDTIHQLLTDGTLTIGRGLRQLYRSDGFCARDGHRTILAGAGSGKKCSVSFESADSCLGILEMGEGADIDWTGSFNVENLGNDVKINTSAENGEGLAIYSKDGRMHFNGHSLTVSGNVRNLSGELYVGGARTMGKSFDPAKAGSFIVDGDFLQQDGDLIADGGHVKVTGDWRIQHMKGDGTYEECGAALVMRNEDDDVQVDGDFYVSGDTGYWDGTDTIHQLLTAGTLTIGKGLHQLYRNDGFRARDNHRTILAGAGEDKQCSVSFESADSSLGILEMGADADIEWTGVFNVENLGNDVTVEPAKKEGIAVHSKAFRMSFNGHTLTVNGNVGNLVGSVCVGGAGALGESFDPAKAGSLFINGNFLQQDGDLVVDGGHVQVTGDWRIQHLKDDGTYGECGAALVMRNASDDVKVVGDFYVSGDTGYWDGSDTIRQMLTAGTLELKSSFFQKYRGDAFRATGNHTTVFSGNGVVAAQFDSNDSYFANVEFKKSPEECFFSRVPCWTKATSNGKEITADDFSCTALLDPDTRTLTLTGWADQSSEIEIPEQIMGVSVTGLGGGIFKNRTNLEKITLPETLTSIENSAFEGCTGLTAVEIPANVTKIDISAFRGCAGLTALELPESLTFIGESAFRGCEGLTAVKLPEALRHIGEAAFYGCEKLAAIDLKNVEEIGQEAFFGCKGLTSLSIPGSVKALGNSAFLNCENVEEVTFAKDTELTFIADNLFNGCRSLKGIELPATITRTGYQSFRDCKALTEFTFPKSVTLIGTSTFLFCENLAKVTFEEGSQLKKIDVSAFEGATALTEILIPEGTEEIERSAFVRCSNLKKAVVPATVTRMNSQIFRETAIETAGPIGSGADYEFGWTEEIPAYGCDYIENLREVTLPETITAIGEYAFSENWSLSSIKLPKGLKTLGSYVFNRCRSLKSIEIPEGVEAVPDRMVNECKALTSVTLPESLVRIGNSAFEDCAALPGIEIPKSVQTLGEGVFSGCTNLTSIEIPEGITLLSNNMFSKCYALENVLLPDTLTEIGYAAFENCQALCSLEIPYGVTRIQSDAFNHCDNLEQLIVPESVVTFDRDAIVKTEKLTMFVDPDSPAQTYAEANDIPYEYTMNLGSTITANVTDDNGGALSSGFSVSWYNAETGAFLGSGKKLRNTPEGTNVLCQVLLEESLGTLYVQPADQTVTSEKKDQALSYTLTPIRKAALRGTVKDAEGRALPGAALKLRQTFNGIYSKTAEARADENGRFAFDEIGAVSSFLTVSADGYFDVSLTIMAADLSGEAYEAAVVLEKMPEDKVTLNLSVREAARPGETAEVRRLTSFEGLKFTGYNETGGRELEAEKDFRVQYPYIILSGAAAAAGDVLRLNVTDENNTLTAESVRITLDETRCGAADWTLVRNGCICFVNMHSGGAVSVMIFDEEGRNVESGTAQTEYTTAPLSAGQYTCVLMEKTGLFRDMASYSLLAGAGLKENVDFVQDSLNVADGAIAIASGFTVPELDESKFYYTVADETSLRVNYSSAVTGQFVTVRAKYKLQEKYVSETQSATFVIPDGLEFVEKSLTVDSKPAACTAKETDMGTEVAISALGREGTIRFYVLPRTAGTKKLYANLTMDFSSGAVSQPIGTASIEVSNAALTVPEAVGRTTVTVSGKAVADCEVTVYDNGTAVGKTTAKKNGSWSLDIELTKPGKSSVHEIYASVDSQLYGHIETKVSEVLYNDSYVEVAKVTMINTAHDNKTREFVTTFDYLHPVTAVPSYNYWPAYPTFTFLVEFTGGTDKDIANVKVVTINAAGDRTIVPCTYDAATGKWLGTHNYTNFSEVPCWVGVDCDNLTGDIIVEDGFDAEKMAAYLISAKKYQDAYAAKGAERLEKDNLTVGDGKVSFDLTLSGETIGRYTLEMVPYGQFDLSALEEEGYAELVDANGSTYYCSSSMTEDTYTVLTAYPAEKLFAKETYTLDVSGQDGEKMAGEPEGEVKNLKWIELLDKLYNMSLKDIVTAVQKSMKEDSDRCMEELEALLNDAIAAVQMKGQIDGLMDDLMDMRTDCQILKQKLYRLQNDLKKKACKCVTLEGLAMDVWYAALRAQAAMYVYECIGETLGGLAARAMRGIGGEFIARVVADEKVFTKERELLRFIRTNMTELGNVAGGIGKVLLRKYIHHTFDISEENAQRLQDCLGDIADELIESHRKDFSNLLNIRGRRKERFRKMLEDLADARKKARDFKCPCEQNGGKCECYHFTTADFLPATPIADPSGYVYEAVPSNRLEGVTAAIYEYTYAVDEFGIPAEEKSEIFWDAAAYDQVNPQTTLSDGTFGWDVPEGQWLVKFTKDGYEDADSHKDVACDADGYLPVPPIQTEVNTAMVSKAAPAVANAAAYPAEVQLDFTQYMQIETVTANVTVMANGKSVAGEIVPLNAEDNYEGTAQYASAFAFRPEEEISGSVTIKVSGAKSYNGKTMTAAFEKTESVEPMPTSLEISGDAAIRNHETAELTVKVLPAEAGANRTLTVTAYSPSILSAASETITTDANGVAKVTLAGNLPGQGILEVSLDGTKLSREIRRTVYAGEEAPKLQDIADARVEGISDVTYTGKAIEPVPTVTFEEQTLTANKDYTLSYEDNISVGTARVILEGIGSFTGRLVKEFKILPIPAKDLAEASVSGLSDVTYTGEAFEPKPTVTLEGKTLTENTDYTVAYEDNTNAGEAKVVLTGKGSYTGTRTETFTIGKAAQKIACKVSAVAAGAKAAFAVTGAKGAKFSVASSNKAVLKVTKTVQSSKKFQVQGVKVGTAKLTIKVASTDNYALGKVVVTVKVVPAATTKIQVTNLTKGQKIAWAKVAGATGYLVYCNGTLIKTITNASANSLSYAKANTNAKKYVYKVVAKAATGTSTLSKSVTTYRVAPTAFTVAKNSAAGTIGLKWNQNAKATGYQVQYAVDKSFKKYKTLTIKGAKNVTKKIAKLTKGKPYYVRVRAYKTVSKTTFYSSWSGSKAVKITK